MTTKIDAATNRFFNDPRKPIGRKTAELVKNVPKNYETIEDSTGLIPEVIADRIVREEIILRLNLTKRLKDGPALAKYLEDRLIKTYDVNENFKKKLKGYKGRDTAYMFMRHWASSYIKKNWSEKEAKSLGEDFHRGLEVPLTKATKPKTIVKPVVTKTELKKTIEKPVKLVEKKVDKPLKSWKGGDKKNIYEIELVKDGDGHSINTYTSNSINPKARQKSSSYMPKLTDKEAIAKYNEYLKSVTTAKGLNVKKTTIKEKAHVFSKKDDDMNIEAKLAVFAKKKVIKKKRTSKQVLNHLKNGGKKLLKLEERLKAKKEAINKELEKLKLVKTKHHARMLDHIKKVKDRETKKAGAINPPTKFNKEDLSVAVKKKDK